MACTVQYFHPVLPQAREQQAGVVNIRSDDDLEPDELLGQFSSRDAEKVLRLLRHQCNAASIAVLLVHSMNRGCCEGLNCAVIRPMWARPKRHFTLSA